MIKINHNILIYYTLINSIKKIYNKPWKNQFNSWPNNDSCSKNSGALFTTVDP